MTYPPPKTAVFLVEYVYSVSVKGDNMDGTLIAWMVFNRKSMGTPPAVAMVTSQEWMVGRQLKAGVRNRSIRLAENPEVMMAELLSGVFAFWKVRQGFDLNGLSCGSLIERTNERNISLRVLLQRQSRELVGLYDLYVRAYASSGEMVYLGSFATRNKAMEYLEARIEALQMLESHWWRKSVDWFVIE